MKRTELKRSSSSLSSSKKGRRGTQPRRDWTEAREKVEREGRCRVCGQSAPKLEAAHVIGREHDEPKVPGGKTLWVNPDRIVPLCGSLNPPWGDQDCHVEYDAHRLDLLPVLTLDEQLQAVRDAGGIALALRRVSGRNYGEKGSVT